MKKTDLYKKGFTLMELIVVMAILGILAIMVLGNYAATQKKKNDLKRKSDLVQLGKALEIYNNDFGRYPAASAGKITGCGATTDVCEWGISVFKDNASTVVYMPKIPADPKGTQNYFYETDASGTYYKLYALLENLDDPAKITSTQVCKSGPATNCNFGVSSTNVNP